VKLFFLISSQVIKFSEEELSEIKRVASGHLRLLGFKPLSCLKDYHNLRPSTFLYPSDQVTSHLFSLLCVVYICILSVFQTCG